MVINVKRARERVSETKKDAKLENRLNLDKYDRYVVRKGGKKQGREKN